MIPYFCEDSPKGLVNTFRKHWKRYFNNSPERLIVGWWLHVWLFLAFFFKINNIYENAFSQIEQMSSFSRQHYRLSIFSNFGWVTLNEVSRKTSIRAQIFPSWRTEGALSITPLPGDLQYLSIHPVLLLAISATFVSDGFFFILKGGRLGLM